MNDEFGRRIDYIRISLTDRCNLRCLYCMPKGGIQWLDHSEILTFEEIERLCVVLAKMGVSKIKITGGEPLVRKGCTGLIKRLKAIDGINEVTMTTNGVLFETLSEELYNAGLDGVNFSMDTLKSERYKYITGFDGLESVKTAIFKAVAMGFKNIKINCVPMEGFNDDEIADIAEISKNNAVSVRFIEMMPIGLGENFGFISNEAILSKLEKSFGKAEVSLKKHGNGPAYYYSFKGFRAEVGFISALSGKFCESCNRIRLTANGNLKLCLHRDIFVDIKRYLRAGCDDDLLREVIGQALKNKPKEHSFYGDDRAGYETKKMFQIGG